MDRRHGGGYRGRGTGQYRDGRMHGGAPVVTLERMRCRYLALTALAVGTTLTSVAHLAQRRRTARP